MRPPLGSPGGRNVAGIVTVALVCVVAACRSSEPREGERVCAHLGAERVDDPAATVHPTPRQSSVTVCRRAISETWDEYVKRARGALGPEYHVVAEQPDSVTFSRTLSGDIYRVHIERVRSNASLIQVTFTATPW
jgi:hypothetical protein